MDDQTANFNNDETSHSKHDQDIEKLRDAARELVNLMPKLIEQFNDLIALKYRTPDEEELLQKIKLTLVKLYPYIIHYGNYFGERALKGAVAFYYNAKELARQGNGEAQKIVDDLKPSFDASLMEKMNESLN